MLRTLCRPAGSAAPRSYCRRLAAGEILHGAGEVQHHVFMVLGGGLTCRVEDGDRRALDTFGPGEVIGLDALDSGRHSGVAAAHEPSAVCAVPVARLRRSLIERPEAAAQLARLAGDRIARRLALRARSQPAAVMPR